MADTKITALGSQTGTNVDPPNDILVTVDVSDTSMGASGTDKKITFNDLMIALGVNGAALLVGEQWILP